MGRQFLDCIKICLFFFVLALIAYLGSLNSYFMVDDHGFSNKNHANFFITISDYFTKSSNQHYIPLYYLLNISLFKWFGLNIILYHIHNLVIFVIFCTLLYFFLKELTENKIVALIASSLFCLHPIHHSFVSYITLNSTTYMGICSLLSLHLLLKWNNNKQYHTYCLSLVLFLLSLLFKDLNITFPIYVFLIFYILKNYSFNKSLKITAPFFFISCLYFLIWIKISYSNVGLLYSIKQMDLTIITYGLSIAKLVGWYITNLFFPLNIVLIYNTPSITSNYIYSASIAFFILLFFLITHKKTGTLVIKFSISFFLAGFITVLILPFTHAYMGLVIEPHWLFIPSIGFFLCIAIILEKAYRSFSKLSSILIIGSICMYLVIFNWHYSKLWKNEKTYCQYWISVTPENPIPIMLLAKIYANEKNFGQSLYWYKKLLDFPDFRPHVVNKNIGLLKSDTNDLNSAKFYLKKAIQIKPEYADSYNALAAVYVKEKNLDKAKELFIRCREVDPFHTLAGLNLADIYIIEGNFDEAKKVAEDLMKKSPEHRDVKKLYKYLNSNPY